MKKKLLSLISTVLCLCVVLSACGRPTVIRHPLHPKAKAETTPKTKPLPLRP